MKKTTIIIGFILIWLVVMYILNFFILEKIIIPDPCYYHSHDTNKVFDLFYELTAKEGYHPTPTRLNVILTLITGGLAGLILGIKLSKTKKNEIQK